MDPFDPLFKNPHLQTIAGHLWPRPFDTIRFPSKATFYQTEPTVQVLVETQRPGGNSRGEVVLVHGLEGSGAAGYMRSLSHAAVEAGYTAHRFHMRTCGGTEHLCQTLYHAGLTSDLLSVLREFAKDKRAPVHLVGFSLGGNVVLKLAGELGNAAGGLIASVCAISTPLDLGVCARRIGQADNRLYESRFVRLMRSRLLATGRYTAADFRGMRSVYDIDNRITAPSFGFRDADDYYNSQSSGKFLDAIRTPTLLIQAKDDTFIPFGLYQHPAFQHNPHLRLLATEYGGHVGFIARRPPRFWLDCAVVEWIGKNGESVP